MVLRNYTCDDCGENFSTTEVLDEDGDILCSDCADSEDMNELEDDEDDDLEAEFDDENEDEDEEE